MNVCKLLALSFALLPTLVLAQSKILTMEEAILKGNTTLAPKNLSNLQWRDGSRYTYTRTSSTNDVLMQGHAHAGKKADDSLFSLQSLNDAMAGANATPLKRWPAASWITPDELLFHTDKGYYIYDLAGKRLRAITRSDSGAQNLDFHKESHHLAFTIDNNLYVSREDQGKSMAVTQDKDKGIVNGQSVHRNEFGIHNGTFWSPKGSFLAFYRMDETMVTDYPLMEIGERPGEARMIKYPMAGMKSHHVTIGVYDMASRATIFLKTGEPAEQYLTNVTWSPDEKHIYVAVLNRAQNHMKLNKYDAKTGNFVSTLFEERHDKYVEPLNPLFFFKKNPREFLWLSDRDGYRHLYRYNTDGKLAGQITKGNWMVTEILGMDEDEKNVYFLSTMESPIGISVYKVNLSSKNITKLSDGQGMHTAFLSTDGKYVINRFSSASTPRRISLVKNDGQPVRALLQAENPLKDYKLGTTRLFTLQSKDGQTLHCRMILPPDFDSTKKYPSITYLYGGPHAQMVNNSWLGGSNLWMQYAAQQGFIVFTLDNHGSMNRGRDFEQATFRRLGEAEMEDQLVGANYLKSLPYIDAARLGIHGWSFGGFMTTTMMLKAPGTYKVAVAGGPVIDWKYYEVMYTERYMDTPEENREGYEKANLLNHVKNLNGKLLMIHGVVDDVVVIQHSLMFLKKCVDEGKQLDYFVYPGHPHNVIGKDRVHLMNKVTDYFKLHL